MKRLIPFIAMMFLLTGCFAEEERSALDAVRSESNQTTHYRPVHKLHEDWTIRKLGRTITLRTDETRVKISARRDSKSVIIRENSAIIGSVEKTENGAGVVIAADINEDRDAVSRERADYAVEFICMGGRASEIKTSDRTYRIRPTQSGLVSEGLEVRRLKIKRRYSIVDSQQSGTCEGIELESPFSALGTLIFHFDGIPLAQRTALAWYVTEFNADCSL